MSYLDDVRAATLEHCPGFLMEILPGGHVIGGYYKCGTLHGGEGDSVTVNLKSGKWGEWNGGPTGGDLIALYSTVKSIAYKQALHELAERWGIKPGRKKALRSQDWTVVLPVPSNVYQVGEDFYPQFPAGVLSQNPNKYWAYFDEQGGLLCFVARYDSPNRKKFFQPLSYWRHLDGHMEWLTRGLPVPRPLYNLQFFTQDITDVLVVEGESCADAAMRLIPNWWSTTWLGGSQNPSHADWTPVRKLQTSHVVLWPDKDRAGEGAMNVVAKYLAFPLEIVETDPRWPEGYDIADLERDGWTPDQIAEYIASHTTRLEPEPPPKRIEVVLDGRDVYTHMEAIWQALPETEAPIYTTIVGTSCLRRNIRKGVEVEKLEPESFRALLRPFIRTKRYERQELTDCSIQDDLAAGLLFNMNGHAPILEAIYHTPIVTQGGRLLDTTGYHDSSRAWLNIPDHYEHGMDIERAWEVMGDLLIDFPFETTADETNALSFLLAGIMRPSIDGPTPLYRFESPVAGTGKSLLCQSLSEILCPHVAALIPSDNEEESRKRIAACLLSMPIVTIFDNVEKFDNIALKVALTADRMAERVMREHRVIEIPIRTLWACSVNNPILSPEMFRRSVRVRLNAKMANPETRDPKSFRHPEIVSYVRKNRGLFLSALVSIIEFGLSSKDMPTVASLGGYERWAKTVGSILATNGYEGFLGNLEEDRRLTEDSQTAGFGSLVRAWWASCGKEWITPSGLAHIVTPEMNIGVKRDQDGRVSPRSMGWLLSKHRGEVIDGLCLQGPIKKSGEIYYWLSGEPNFSTEKSNQTTKEQEKLDF